MIPNKNVALFSQVFKAIKLKQSYSKSSGMNIDLDADQSDRNRSKIFESNEKIRHKLVDNFEIRWKQNLLSISSLNNHFACHKKKLARTTTFLGAVDYLHHKKSTL